MKRHEMAYLVQWKDAESRKPLVIRGARQVGKTWLMKTFGKEYYNECAYINFESTPLLKSIFEENFDIDRILTAIHIETGILPEPGKTLLILDEIQEAPGGLTALKYFRENAPEQHIIAAGSLLGVSLSRPNSFPVGKVDFLDLYPFDFLEFLEAIDEKALADLLESRDWELINKFSMKLSGLLKQYYYVGGMPEAVSSFSKKRDFTAVRDIQKNILLSYEQDFSKHAPADIVPRIRMVWQSIPSQLAKENRKFIYGILKTGARAKDYELALAWLIDCGLLHKVSNVNKPGLPLKAYEDLSAFKLFLADVGLLSAMTDMDARSILEGNTVFQEFKGALTEQYVLQQLISSKRGPVYYWSPSNARSEIDFLVQHAGHVIPVEVKAEENLQAKSLRIYCQQYKPSLAIRTSLSLYREEDWMTNLPLYAIRQLYNLEV